MFEYFKITALNKADFEQLVWLFTSKKFFPESSSNPALPRFPNGTFDYRELLIMDQIDNNARSIDVRTRQPYSLIQFGTNVIPTAEWVSRYKLSGTPVINGITIIANRNANFRALSPQGGRREFLVYEYPADSEFYRVSPNLQSWYDALTVKPGFTLLKSLNTLIDGLVEDGDIPNMDLLAITGGMETDEQRFLPFKTTSGNNLLPITAPYPVPGNLITNGLGVSSDGSSCLSLRWNPALHGVNYKQNDALFGAYITLQGGGNSSIIGGEFTPDQIAYNAMTMYTTGSTVRGYLNSEGPTNLGSSSPVFQKRLKCLFRNNAATINVFNVNRITQSTNISTVSQAPANIELYSLDSHYIDLTVPSDGPSQSTYNGFIGAFLIGNSSINLPRFQARLDQFFTERGMSVMS